MVISGKILTLFKSGPGSDIFDEKSKIGMGFDGLNTFVPGDFLCSWRLQHKAFVYQMIMSQDTIDMLQGRLEAMR